MTMDKFLTEQLEIRSRLLKQCEDDIENPEKAVDLEQEMFDCWCYMMQIEEWWRLYNEMSEAHRRYHSNE